MSEKSTSERDLARGPWYSLSSRPHRTESGPKDTRPDSATEGLITRIHDRGLYVGAALAALFAFARLTDITETGPAALLLLCLLGAAGLLSALFRPSWFPAIVVAYFPFSMQYPFVVGMGINMTNVLLLMGVAAIFSQRGQKPHRYRFGVFEFLLIILLVFGFAGFLQTYRVMRELGLFHALTIFKRWASPFLFFFVIRTLLQNRRDMARVLGVMTWNTVLVALLTWWIAIERGPRSSIEASRISGIFNGPNEMGTFLVYAAMPLLAVAVWRTRALRRMFHLSGFLIAVRAMLFTFSRGAYVSLAVGSTVLLLFRSPIYLVGIFGAGTAAVIIDPGLIPDSVLARIGETTDEPLGDGLQAEDFDKSVSQRFMLWQAAFEVIRDYPLSGVGLGRFPYYVDAYSERPLGDSEPRDAHNAYLLVAAELGIPALCVMLAILVTLIVTTLRLYLRRKHPFDRLLSLATLGSVSALACTFLFGSRFSDENYIGYFWILAAAVMVLRHLPALKARRELGT